jgi:hypothetical protein
MPSGSVVWVVWAAEQGGFGGSELRGCFPGVSQKGGGVGAVWFGRQLGRGIELDRVSRRLG